jgi:hypothetical protein
MKYVLITLTLLTTLFACKRNTTVAPRVINNVTQMYIPNGWRPVGITVDTTNNGINENIDVWDACNADNKNIFLASGIVQYYTGAIKCDSIDVDEQIPWWWDNATPIGNTAFFTVDNSSGVPDTQYANIIKLTADSFNYSSEVYRTNSIGLIPNYAKFYFKSVPF